MSGEWAPHARLDVLWLEDDPAFVQAARSFFHHEGTDSHTVLPWRVDLRHVTTLAEALQAIAAAPPAIMVADLNLPDSNGPDTVQALRRAMPRGPLVILSGQGDAAIGLTAGIYDTEFLDKDMLTLDSLWRTMFMALSRDRADGRPPARHIEPQTR